MTVPGDVSRDLLALAINFVGISVKGNCCKGKSSFTWISFRPILANINILKVYQKRIDNYQR
jgi:hypothetical protein